MISSGKEFDGRQAVLKILTSAKQEISIVDAYFKGDSAFTLISEIDSRVRINVIVSPKTAREEIFKVPYGKLIKQGRPNLKIRQSDGLHPRHIIIDGKDVW